MAAEEAFGGVKAAAANATSRSGLFGSKEDDDASDWPEY